MKNELPKIIILAAQSLNCSELLKITIEETLNRELKFYENLDCLFKKEAFYLQNNFENLPELMVGLRPEVEKWRMRCEEMETKLGEYKGKMSNMSVVPINLAIYNFFQLFI